MARSTGPDGSFNERAGELKVSLVHDGRILEAFLIEPARRDARFMRRFVVASLCLAPLAFEPSFVAGREPSDGVRKAQMMLDELRRVAGVPGLSASVATSDETLWNGTTGWADVELEVPVHVGSRFRLASVSKLFTAMAALRLWEEGLLDVDADIRGYVPSWPAHDGAVISTRHLASHTAGINHYQSAPSRSDRHYADIGEALGLFADYPLLDRPGGSYAYSSFGYALLNAVIASVADTTFDAVLDRLVLQPLNLRNTGLEDVRSLPPGSVALYGRGPDGGLMPLEPNDQSFVFGASGMRSTAEDVATFAAGVFSGRVVAAPTTEMALQPTRLNDGTSATTGRYGIGFGWRVGSGIVSQRIAHHTGATPGARSVALAFPDHGIGVALLANGPWIARLEPTAELLALPFTAWGVERSGCPVGTWNYQGSFAGEREDGHVRIAAGNGHCVGSITSTGALRDLWSEASTLDGLTLVRLAASGPEHLFALVHPWGLSRLTLTVGAGRENVSGDVAGRALRISSSND